MAMERRRWYGLCPVIVGMLLLLAGMAGVQGSPSYMQYAVGAPEVQGTEGETFREALDALDRVWEGLSDAVALHTIHGKRFDCTFAGDQGATQQGTVYAVAENWFEVYPKLLTAGRLPYQEELERGDNIILLDEDLAMALFFDPEPIGRFVTIDKERYRVIGVVRHRRQLGEVGECGAYISLARIQKEMLLMDMLVVTAMGKPHSGSMSAFSMAMEDWRSGGNVYSVEKEVTRATMPLRIVFCLLSGYAVVWLLRRLTQTLSAYISKMKGQLQKEYLRRLLPVALWNGILFAMGYAALLASCIGLITFALQPVYVFPEWIPAVIVEWSDIRNTFWRLADMAVKPIRYVTPEVAKIHVFAFLMQCGLTCILCGLAVNGLHRFFERRHMV